MPSQAYLKSYTEALLKDRLADGAETCLVNFFMPCEIFHAMGVPVTALEMLAMSASCTDAAIPFSEMAQASGCSSSFCSLHRVVLGMAERGICQKPKMIANTTLACDANLLSFRYLADKWQVPHQVIDVPYETSEESVAYVADQLREMVLLTEETYERKLDENKLKGAIARSVRTQDNYRCYLSERPRFHLPKTLMPELLNGLNNHVYLGLPEAESYSEMCLGELKTASFLTTQKKILWMHILPNGQTAFHEIFEGEANDSVEIVGCDLAYDSLVSMDPEKPYESMARRLVMNRFNGSGRRRMEATLAMAEVMKADGILIFCQWGCKSTQGLALTAKKLFEAHHLPTLVIDGDACDRSNGGSGQVMTRMQAFIEQLEGRA